MLTALPLARRIMPADAGRLIADSVVMTGLNEAYRWSKPMHVYVYHAEVLDLESAEAVRFRLDLGFRVYDSERDGWPPHLWRYPATLVRVIDGDTFDARVSIYPGLAIEERFRLSRINAPEIFGRRRDDPEYIRGIATRDYVVARFREHDGRMILHTSRRGKWRRWLGEVFVGDSTTRLNDELLRKRLAVVWSRASHRAPRTNSEPLALGPELRDRILDNAARLGLQPGELLERALTRYLE